MKRKILIYLSALIIIVASASAYGLSHSRMAPNLLSVNQINNLLNGKWSMYGDVQHYNSSEATKVILSLVPQASAVLSGSFECLTNYNDTFGMLVIEFNDNLSASNVYDEYANYFGLMNHSTVDIVGGAEYTYVENQTFGSGSGGVAHYSKFFIFVESQNFLIKNSIMKTLVSSEIVNLET